MWSLVFFLLVSLCSAVLHQLCGANLLPCGDACYSTSKYTCYDGNFLCPIENGVPTLKCGDACYLPSMYGCVNNQLVYPPPSSTSGSSASPSSTSGASASCSSPATQFYLADEPYNDYFYSDCHMSFQVVVSSPGPTDNLTLIAPRLLAASPGGNSGVVAFFAPENGINGTLAIALQNSTGSPISPVYAANGSSNVTVGISGLISFNSTAIMNVFILGSIRTIRDFTEGPSILYPEIQNATKFTQTSTGGISLNRVWLDNMTQTTLSFEPVSGGNVSFSAPNMTTFAAGTYNFTTTYDYPQLTQLKASSVLNSESQGLITTNTTDTNSLSFLSYTTKLLAGAWRFLTYFGRDSQISALLLQPVLSQGEGGAIEAVIGAVLERLNQSDGSVCHEETIGDYATYLNQQQNITSTAPSCSYIMIDSDYYLPVVIQNYFVNTTTGQGRAQDFLAIQSPNDFGNGNLTYGQLMLINAEKIMNTSAPFAAPGKQTMDNLIHIKPGQVVGEWRDSTYGIGGGHIPYDVNTGLVPAALRAIGVLANSGFFPTHPDWNTTADQYAQVWEDSTLQFFNNSIPASQAQQLLQAYVSESNFTGPVPNVTAPVNFFGLSLQGNDNQSIVQVMNTDDCFRLFLLNTTNQTQLSAFLSQTADHILNPFPLGLSTDVGLFVANPAFGDNPVYAANWTNSAYHGTVVWSWPMAMIAAGLERQLGRCDFSAVPDFCSDSALYSKIKSAYNHLWDLIEENTAHLSTEVWSWSYENGAFQFLDYGKVSPTEADIVQLWSLTFLAVTRNPSLS